MVGVGVGEMVMVTEEWRGRLFSAVPHTLVESSHGNVVTFSRRGTTGAWATSRGVAGREGLSRAERKLEAMRTGVFAVVEVPLDSDSLHLFAAGSWARVNLAWDASGSFLSWYVNFELPPVITPGRITTMDLVLDAIVTPDREWIWKDEEDFERAIAQGILDPELGTTLRHVADDLRRDAESGHGRFAPSWTTWTPPTGPVPQLPEIYRPGGGAWMGAHDQGALDRRSTA